MQLKYYKAFKVLKTNNINKDSIYLCFAYGRQKMYLTSTKIKWKKITIKKEIMIFIS